MLSKFKPVIANKSSESDNVDTAEDDDEMVEKKSRRRSKLIMCDGKMVTDLFVGVNILFLITLP